MCSLTRYLADAKKPPHADLDEMRRCLEMHDDAQLDALSIANPPRAPVGKLPPVWEQSNPWYFALMTHTERQVIVGDRGRLVLPAAVRSALGIEAGARMLLSTERDGSLRLRPYRSVADQNRGLLADLAPTDASMVDELLAERRREAAREDRDA